MLKILHKTIKEKVPTELEELKTGSWIIAENPSVNELEKISEELKLEADLLRDAMDPNEVPRIEKENKITYIFTRMPYSDDSGQVTTRPILMAIGDKFIFTLFQKESPTIIEKFMSGQVNYATTQKTKLFFLIMSEIHNTYNRFVQNINRGVRKATVDFRTISNREIVSFVQFESTLNDFLSALVPTNVSLDSLLSGKYISLYESDKDLIEDNELFNSQLIETCKSNLKNITNIRDAYSTILTNNLNRVIRLLTALTIILTVPTIISSLFGMNVPIPFMHNQYGFWIVLFITVVVSGAMFAVFKRNKWF
ncbi:magnesium transporter CorA family protein [Candidatus Nomurabacteria bacterium]|nr:magnesium transporter CorA family protein [Candidatus Nomurabacteria bacterium]